MTNEEAAAEVEKRWGKYAACYFASRRISEEGKSYSVYSDCRNSTEEGTGKTWEEAFKDADQKKDGKNGSSKAK